MAVLWWLAWPWQRCFASLVAGMVVAALLCFSGGWHGRGTAALLPWWLAWLFSGGWHGRGSAALLLWWLPWSWPYFLFPSANTQRDDDHATPDDDDRDGGDDDVCCERRHL
jgi:hypothetical protein